MSIQKRETQYHRLDSCNKCGGINNKNAGFSNPFSADGSHCAKTRCDDCGHEDLWDTGFFESGMEIESKCKKYVNRGGKLINL